MPKAYDADLPNSVLHDEWAREIVGRSRLSWFDVYCHSARLLGREMRGFSQFGAIFGVIGVTGAVVAVGPHGRVSK